MARERAKLTDKEERIMVQAQLMGLTTASMVRIGNRLKAIEQEQHEREWIASVTHGYSWTGVPSKDLIELTTPNGLNVRATFSKKTRGNYWGQTDFSYEVTVTKPGSEKKLTKIVNINVDSDWRKKLMPANCYELLGLIIRLRDANLTAKDLK